MLRIYDYTNQGYEHLGATALARFQLARDGEEVVFDRAGGERISLKVEEDRFLGWDHTSGAYFAGAIHDVDVMLFAGLERRYYQFQVN